MLNKMQFYVFVYCIYIINVFFFRNEVMISKNIYDIVVESSSWGFMKCGQNSNGIVMVYEQIYRGYMLDFQFSS